MKNYHKQNMSPNVFKHVNKFLCTLLFTLNSYIKRSLNRYTDYVAPGCPKKTKSGNLQIKYNWYLLRQFIEGNIIFQIVWKVLMLNNNENLLAFQIFLSYLG